MAAARIPLALIVIGAGVFAALHVGKLASALATLQQALGMSLLQAGCLRSLVQLAGMALRLALGALADGLGGRRSMLLGLVTLGGASTAGGLSQGVAPMMALRMVEGFGFLLVVLPVPGLLRTLVPPERLSAALGLRGAYTPLATALALLGGRGASRPSDGAWWWRLGALSLLMALVLVVVLVLVLVLALVLALVRTVPAGAVAAARRPTGRWWAGLRQTLATPGPGLVAAIFAAYSG